MSIFSERLISLIKQAGITQARFASDLGITPQAASCYVKGREPSFDLLIKMAEYFHVSTDYLLGVSESGTVSIRNFGDVTNVLLSMIAQGVLDFFPQEPMDACIDVSFSIPQYECRVFFFEYSKMLRLCTEGSISGNVFATWLGAELAKLQNIPLPQKLTWKNGEWVVESCD